MAGNGPRRPVSMAEVARLAGVSVTTVSHVVNRTRPVARATEQAVRAAIADTGYVPDNVVRSLRATGSRTIGLAMSAISNTYFSDVVRSIERTLSRAGYSLLLEDTHDEVVDELRAVSDLLSRRVDAIILAPSVDPSRPLKHARQQGVPVVLIDRAMPADVDQIATESEEATATLVDHLCGIGHKRIGMISGKPGLGTTEERVRGYRLGLRRNRIGFKPEIVVSGDSTAEGARAAFTQLLALNAPPSGLIVGNNQMTIGVLRAARDAGLNVPGDLALASFDDFEWADLFRPGLTVIAQPTKSMGEQAAEMVLSRLAEPSLPVRRIIMQPTFVHRESCGCGLLDAASSPQSRPGRR